MHISCFVFAALCGGLFLSSHILRICQCFFRCNGFVGIFLDISFLKVTEEGGYSLSTEKFAN